MTTDMRNIFNGKLPEDMRTPFYYYDTDLLNETLQTICDECRNHPDFRIHYAVKANSNSRILQIIRSYGLGADCVSGGEIQAALDAGFSPDRIVFAGVGKADWEIGLALENGISCFNAESPEEIAVINEIASGKGRIARIALRINPDVGAHTHSNITTGLAENKFGICKDDIAEVTSRIRSMPNVTLTGIHFHIGSQILDMTDFTALCNRVNEIQDRLAGLNVFVKHVNVGGGLGIDYLNPDLNRIPDFHSYFSCFKRHLRLRPGQILHFEPGRSVVGQCGSLITKVLYVKKGKHKQFAVVDAGMTELIRPALYQAHHLITNITSEEPEETYDVVGPVCESSDVFGKARRLAGTRRNDLIAIRSAGAYGEVMASRYNCRRLPESIFSDRI